MRNTEQRVNAALRGAKKRKKQQKQRRLQGLMGCICLCLMVMTVTLVPRLVENESIATSSPQFAASIFVSSHSLHYIIIGLISFALGVAFTLLCVYTRKKNGEDRDDD